MARLDYAHNPYAVPVAEATVEARVAFLRHVALLTFLGLSVSGVTSLISAGMAMLIPALSRPMVSGGIMLASVVGAQLIGRLTYSESRPTAMAGFLAGTVLQGVAMGYLILTAIVTSAVAFGNPFIIIAEAATLVGLTVLGMVVYLLTGPKRLSMVGAFLSSVSLPMFALMIMSLVLPSLFGGVFGLVINGVFVLVSAGGLLYALNSVMHTMSASLPIPAAYRVTMGILQLFWNVLMLLMRLQRR